MNKIIKDVLNKIENNGFKAYIVGGYVRDFLNKKDSTDIDICTDALPKDIIEIFKINCESSHYGSINFKISDYNFDITTFRKEKKYLSRKPIDIEYIKDLNEDIIRRDFTINALCMDKNGKIIDLLNGKSDIKNKKIRLIGNNERLKDDPLRILRAIRFATVLDYTMDDNLCDGINMYKDLVKDLSKTRIKNELDKILISKNFKIGLSYLKKFGLLDELEISFDKIEFIPDLCGMWAQIKLNRELPFTKEEKNNILKIQELLKIKTIDNYILYKYGLYITSVAAKIMNYNINEIMDKFEKLPIKTRKDLDISIMQIKELIKGDFKEAKNMEEEIIKKILNNELLNYNNEIIKYIKQG